MSVTFPDDSEEHARFLYLVFHHLPYDGDADRCLCVDEEGNVITGDHILYIYGCYMKERGKLLTNTVVTYPPNNIPPYPIKSK